MPTPPMDIRGTPFQFAVWEHLRAIPPGETRSYSEIARRIGRPLAIRAVGTANGANPVSIVIPSIARFERRVISADIDGAWTASASCWRWKLSNLTPNPFPRRKGDNREGWQIQDIPWIGEAQRVKTASEIFSSGGRYSAA